MKVVYVGKGKNVKIGHVTFFPNKPQEVSEEIGKKALRTKFSKFEEVKGVKKVEIDKDKKDSKKENKK